MVSLEKDVRNFGNQKLLSEVLLNLGDFMKHCNDILKAKSYYEESLSLAKYNNDLNIMYGCYYSLGSISLLSYNTKEAFDNFINCLNYSHFSGNIKQYYSAIKKIGDLFLDINNLEKAEQLLLMSYNYFQNCGTKSEYGSICLSLFILYSDKKMIDESLYYAIIGATTMEINGDMIGYLI